MPSLPISALKGEILDLLNFSVPLPCSHSLYPIT